MYIYIFIHIYTYVRTYVYLYTCINVYKYLCIYVYTYIYVYLIHDSREIESANEALIPRCCQHILLRIRCHVQDRHPSICTIDARLGIQVTRVKTSPHCTVGAVEQAHESIHAYTYMCMCVYVCVCVCVYVCVCVRVVCVCVCIYVCTYVCIYAYI